ncbi:hypothetical protein Dsin_032298 [Dipteronia sinensis]|uniref:ATPase F1/V1/A1 complex alpha/beta subunit N-terminal domain-containing protein n=1 Tax=Dipteronia sinensis TaxID=43782 RepID=A0AAE0DT78_9ROSI|nr:hypothetical protein Dsin_032298 [Dipteronia sinensis]
MASIARTYGLDEVMMGELVEFEEGTIGIALNLESKNVGVVLMGDGLRIQEGSSVKATGKNCSSIQIVGDLGLICVMKGIWEYEICDMCDDLCDEAMKGIRDFDFF